MRRLIGTGITDSNGRVTIDYTGSGAGKVQLMADCGDIQSETYEIIDASLVDYAVTGAKNSNWTNYSNRLTVEPGDDGTLLTGNDSANGYYIAKGDAPFVFTDYQCEFDVVSITGGSYSIRWYHQHQTEGNENIFVLNTQIPETGGHVKITVQDGLATLYVDDVQKTTYTCTVESPYEVAFRFNNGTSNTLKYKNFIIYPI